ncbi:sorbosone dehydrogenase family protein [Tsukamurella strandjordii]|uniref:PQQ-dependent sugar dehydrogenase n=1 Tax=Tsukamurella TaxID=2060 RepID=UPI001C7CE2E6|nr:PQQ-dependent sugar dehydrogenase [Tsukamurella sp. TY48]GIZ98586.1 oxidoreductase [Tsukamurella sp. TY48]
MTIGRHPRLATAAAALLLLTACTQASPSSPPGTGTPSAQSGGVATVVDRLDAPWSIAFAGTAALVSERDSGRILELVGGSTREVGRIDGAVARGEGGLLGIAVRDGALYAFFTTDADNRIDRYELRGSAGSYALGPSRSILTGLPAASTHNGGRIAFGPDGMLYATTGDAGLPDRAQDLDSRAGKILRMTPDGGRPADNPFPGSLVYSYGHRNAQGIAWAPDGRMYASEFGQNTWDELNEIQAGANYGWPEVEGIGRRTGFVDPLQQWPTSEASPSGIAVVGDRLYIANLRGQRLRVVPLAAPSTSTEQLVREFGRLRDVAPAPGGGVWALTNNTDGRGAPRAGDDRILRIN